MDCATATATNLSISDGKPITYMMMVDFVINLRVG